MSSDALSNLLQENRVFAPTPEFAAQANAQPQMYEQGADRLEFWAEQARALDWFEPFTEVLDWSEAPFAKWFVGGRLNVAHNCVDRHVAAGHGEQVAIRFEGEAGDRRDITYAQLQDEVCQAANALGELGITAGDRVAIYMPMIPEAIVAMLACARIGAPHSVVFGGFSAHALSSRIDDAQAKLVITADGQNRRGSAMPLKPAVDEALDALAEQGTSPVSHVIVVKRTGGEVAWTQGRDIWWHDLVDRQSTEHEAEGFDSEHPLFILYTSGTTGKPKG
ncbi:MAG: AMP-binding protein, partial [Actinomycetales bacterium]